MTWVTHHRFLWKLTNHRTLLCVHPIITTLKRIGGKACHLYMLCNWECVCAVFCGTGGDAEETYRISAAGESRASFLHLRAGGREPQPERTPKGTHRWGKTDFHFTFTQIFRMNGIYYIVKKLTSCISSSSNFSCNLISFFICVCLFYTLTGHNHEWWNSSTEKYEDASGLEQLLRTDNSTARQLRETEHRLKMKENKVQVCHHWSLTFKIRQDTAGKTIGQFWDFASITCLLLHILCNEIQCL